MLQKVDRILKEKCLIKPGQKILLGVSGGPDSLCLLEILYQLEYPIIVAHLDHTIRESSTREAAYVREIAEAKNLPFVSEKINVKEYAKSHHISIEEAARILRYQFLFKQAEKHHAHYVMVGHTANDQVETVLMHLLRGAGLSGLKGMEYAQQPNAWSRNIPLLRPLLNTWRDEIIEFVREMGLQPIVDESNLDTTYFRNRLRHELIPFLETFNANAKRNIWQTADILQGDYAIIEKETSRIWQKAVAHSGKDYIGFNYQTLKNTELGIQRNLLRKAIKSIKPEIRDITYNIIEQLTEFINSPPKTLYSDLFANIVITLEEPILWISIKNAELPKYNWPQIESPFELPIDKNIIIPFPQGWELQIESLPVTKELRSDLAKKAVPFEAWLDKDTLQHTPILRGRKPGDIIKPLGMNNATVKIADFMVNKKIPKRARAKWPLLSVGDEIVWIPGFIIGEAYKITNHTQNVLHIKFLHHNK